MLKLFEGILEARLQVFSEKAETLTPSQQGSRPGRQRHDAIYGLLAAVQQQRQSPQKPTQGATPSLGASYCGFVDFTTATSCPYAPVNPSFTPECEGGRIPEKKGG